LKIIPGRTIALIIHNGKLGVVIEKYLNKWTIKSGMDSWILEEKGFIPVLNLRKEANRTLFTPDEIIGRHKVAILNALRKAVSLTKENQQLRIDVSTSRFTPKTKT